MKAPIATSVEDLCRRILRETPGAPDDGRCWPLSDAEGDGRETMIGRPRLNNFVACIHEVIERNIPGDIIEAGVWRGGACIVARGVLTALGDKKRRIFVADSFEGLPPPDVSRYPADAGDTHHTYKELAVSLNEVKANFARYGLLDDRVVFLKGWFENTLPAAAAFGGPIKRLSVMRLDGDMYSSTTQAIEALYPKLSIGGFCIVDDYGHVPGARAAIDDFRRKRGVDDEIRVVDWSGVWWRKTRHGDA